MPRLSFSANPDTPQIQVKAHSGFATQEGVPYRLLWNRYVLLSLPLPRPRPFPLPLARARSLPPSLPPSRSCHSLTHPLAHRCWWCALSRTHMQHGGLHRWLRTLLPPPPGQAQAAISLLMSWPSRRRRTLPLLGCAEHSSPLSAVLSDQPHAMSNR